MLTPEEQAGVQAFHALGQAPYSMQATAVRALAAQKARNSIDEASAELYADAEQFTPKSILELEDPKRYAAWCVLCMKHETKTRSKINMVMHIGKVFGHDKRTLEVKDVTSVRDIVRRFQQEFKDKAVVEGRAVVKQVDAGS